MKDKNKKPGVGFGIMTLRDNKVLLGRRHDDSEKASSSLHGEGTWTMPGGKLDFKKDLEEGACREVFEETGIKIEKENLKIISVTNDIIEDAHFVTIGFLCKDFEGEPQVMESDEITRWNWFELDELPSPIFFPSKKILNNFINKQI